MSWHITVIEFPFSSKPPVTQQSLLSADSQLSLHVAPAMLWLCESEIDKMPKPMIKIDAITRIILFIIFIVIVKTYQKKKKKKTEKTNFQGKIYE